MQLQCACNRDYNRYFTRYSLVGDFMIILHQYLISPFCDKIRRVLHWKGIEYDVKEYALTDRKAVATINPAGKLPCLEHDGLRLSDSTDIAYYLEEKFPQRSLIPSDPRQRALVHMLEDWADESLFFYEMFLRFALPQNAERNLPRMLHQDKPLMRRLMPMLIPRGIRSIIKKQGLGRKSDEQLLMDLRRQFIALNERLGDGGWLVGDGISLADIAVYAMVACCRDSKEGVPLLRENRKVADWLKQVEDATGGPVPGSWEI